ncbi:hypothetical protein L2E82_26148 [Cichorium intybus]|uniref:Uncharacterized protein n=1 Tax=Cichorium intybus TaxID=13427 RepID=A0ACB9E6G7_CICIN|nr:hypothetical protein L2E82_26148 [Cichorium intybus]
MLGSSAHSNYQALDVDPSPPPRTADQLHCHRQHTDIRQILLCCAQLISRSDFSAAHRLTCFLSANSSPYGDSSERVIHSFTKALSLRLHHLLRHCLPPVPTGCCNDFCRYLDRYDDGILQSSYLSLNQITPFVRFSHLTANQAILEAIDPSHHPRYIHILDFDIMHGVQWPPLMQAIADRYPPPTPTLRITSTGTNLDDLRRTGDRLSDFAHSLGLSFRFHPLLLPNVDNVDDLVYHLSAVILLPDEILAVNCVLYLHRLLKNRETFFLLLRKIKTMNPKVITLAEQEASHNHPLFLSRFGEALNYYTAVFDSLEATLPPNSRERMEVEQVWFGREIADVVAAEGENRRERHERFRSWEVMMRSAGFANVALSPFAVSQAKLLLRLHYPSEGYNLEVVNDSFFLGWRNQLLFSVSSWH